MGMSGCVLKTKAWTAESWGYSCPHFTANPQTSHGEAAQVEKENAIKTVLTALQIEDQDKVTK